MDLTFVDEDDEEEQQGPENYTFSLIRPTVVSNNNTYHGLKC